MDRMAEDVSSVDEGVDGCAWVLRLQHDVIVMDLGG
jgi:hypothetical protein